MFANSQKWYLPTYQIGVKNLHTLLTNLKTKLLLFTPRFGNVRARMLVLFAKNTANGNSKSLWNLLHPTTQRFIEYGQGRGLMFNLSKFAPPFWNLPQHSYRRFSRERFWCIAAYFFSDVRNNDRLWYGVQIYGHFAIWAYWTPVRYLVPGISCEAKKGKVYNFCCKTSMLASGG